MTDANNDAAVIAAQLLDAGILRRIDGIVIRRLAEAITATRREAMQFIIGEFVASCETAEDPSIERHVLGVAAMIKKKERLP